MKETKLESSLFEQAKIEVLESIASFIDELDNNEKSLITKLLEPEKVIKLEIKWINEQGIEEVNTGYRVWYSSLLGIYKGGIRFTKNLSLDSLKMLAFEQTFKNAIIPYQMGGAKGGADFDPRDRSLADIKLFSEAFIKELAPYLNDDLDIPAGDLGVSSREISFMNNYLKLLNQNTKVGFTGKDIHEGGSKARKEATGYGLVYFTSIALEELLNTSFKNKRVIISGSGNVGIYAAKKVNELGGIVVAMSDSRGFIYNVSGVNLEVVKKLKEEARASLKGYLEFDNLSSYEDDPKGIWSIPCDIAFPCATEGELGILEARSLIKNKVILVAEGANKPTTNAAAKLIKENNVIFCPAKVANAGGVLTSALEIIQNKEDFKYSFAEVDKILEDSMKQIFKDVLAISRKYNKEKDLLFGANLLGITRLIAGYKKSVNK